MIRSVFTATGSFIPATKICNEDFLDHQFLEKGGASLNKANAEIIKKFTDITGIKERRYAQTDHTASDLGYFAAKDALESSGIDKESLDYIIVAHNFGDVLNNSNRVSIVPTLASKIKCLLQIKNPDCVAYDLPFGCPGWVEGVIQASYYIRSGDAKRCLVIGTETLSRVIDPHDRDSMLYGDGSGAVIVEASNEKDRGILSHKTQTHACDHSMLLTMDSSYSTASKSNDLFIKMNGRKLYEFALNEVPLVIKSALDKAHTPLSAISKVLIHQANEKMDNAILERVFLLCGEKVIPENLMPMTISSLGNSSVATVPTLLDLILKEKLDLHRIRKGEKVIVASVGAGMNINAIVYQF